MRKIRRIASFLSLISWLQPETGVVNNNGIAAYVDFWERGRK
jgi:hypothetical protein